MGDTALNRPKTGFYKVKRTGTFVLIFQGRDGCLCYQNNRHQGVITHPENAYEGLRKLTEKEIKQNSEELSKLEKKAEKVSV